MAQQGTCALHVGGDYQTGDCGILKFEILNLVDFVADGGFERRSNCVVNCVVNYVISPEIATALKWSTIILIFGLSDRHTHTHTTQRQIDRQTERSIDR
jgi:hypothetical protein